MTETETVEVRSNSHAHLEGLDLKKRTFYMRHPIGDEARAVRAEAKGIERMIIHCELDLGMRRIELLRLKVGSFVRGRIRQIQIHGKGRNGGKHRQISWHPDTEAILDDYLRNVRQPMIDRARKKNPNVRVPDELFIYEMKGELHPYKKIALDKFLMDIGERVGIHFTNHDLRRTCGRMMYRAGVRLEEISGSSGMPTPERPSST